MTVRTGLGSVEFGAAARGFCGGAAGVPCAGATGAGSTTRGADGLPSSLSTTGSSCRRTSCSLLAALASRSISLLDCGSIAVVGTILVGVVLSALITGGGSFAPGWEM